MIIGKRATVFNQQLAKSVECTIVGFGVNFMETYKDSISHYSTVIVLFDDGELDMYPVSRVRVIMEEAKNGGSEMSEQKYTCDEWKERGFSVIKGEKSCGRNKDGVCVFSESQVTEKSRGNTRRG